MKTVHEVQGSITIADMTLSFCADGDSASFKVDTVVAAEARQEGGHCSTTKSTGWVDCNAVALKATIVLFVSGGDDLDVDGLYTAAKSVASTDSDLVCFP